MYDLSSLIAYILCGEFGILTMMPEFLLIILFPMISIFYFLRLCLEESGLLCRISLRLDRYMSPIGLSGQSILVMSLGFACVTAALGAATSISNKRERLLASILLCMIVPCSAQVAINIALAFLLSPPYILFYTATTIFIFLILSYFLNKYLPKIPFCHTPMQYCNLRFPSIRKNICTSIPQGFSFIRETLPAFAFGSVLISLLSFYNYLPLLCNLLSPITTEFLHLPEEASIIFIMAIVKKDLAAASLLSIFESGIFSPPQITLCAIILTLFVPCYASMAVLYKQEKLPITIGVWMGSFIFSILLGKLISILLL